MNEQLGLSKTYSTNGRLQDSKKEIFKISTEPRSKIEMPARKDGTDPAVTPQEFGSQGKSDSMESTAGWCAGGLK